MMRRALEQAKKAYDMDEVPVGAIVVHEPSGRVLAATHNRVETDANPTAHAELIAISWATNLMSEKYLSECTLYVTLEPCAMCAAAISLAKIKKLVFGAYDPKGGAVEFGPKFFSQPTCHHAPEVVGGVMESECSALLKQFFAAKRGQ